MKTHYKTLTFIIAFSLATSTLIIFSRHGEMAAAASTGVLRDSAAIEALKKSGEYTSLADAYEKARYSVAQTLDADAKKFAIGNPANEFAAEIDNAALKLGDSSPGSWQLDWKLKSFGYGADQRELPAGTAFVKGNRMEYQRSPVFTEWFENTEKGLEQGFIISERLPASSPNEKLQLQFSVGGGLLPKAEPSGQAIALIDKQGVEVMRYEKLKAWDARGEILTAQMSTDGASVTLDVDDSSAVYPVTIDPTFARSQILVAPDGAASDSFGETVAISGNTILVAATGADINGNANQGAVYAFVRNGSQWVFQQKLTANDGAAGDGFGSGIAIQGDTAFIGAAGDDIASNVNQGSVYIFTRGGAVWTQQSKLTASDGAANDLYGSSVSVSGYTLAVGAPGDASNGQIEGSAYVLVSDGYNWQESTKIVDAGGAWRAGGRVKLENNTLLISAVGNAATNGSVSVWFRNGTVWSRQLLLEMGFNTTSGDLNGDLLAVQEGSSAKIYTRTGAVWTHRHTAQSSGEGLSVEGDHIQFGEMILQRNGNTWRLNQRIYISGLNEAGTAGVEISAMDSETIALGQPYARVGENQSQGTVAVYRPFGAASPAGRTTASDGLAGDRFGSSVSIYGDTAVIGAALDDFIASVDQGSAYVFKRTAQGWVEDVKLFAGAGGAGDQFGSSVAIFRDTMLIGAPQANSGSLADTGAVYRYTRSSGTWSPPTQMSAFPAQANSFFGASVAISAYSGRLRLAVGAPAFDNGTSANQGAVYFYEEDFEGDLTSFQALSTDGAAGDQFGTTVALEGDFAVIGAPLDDVNADIDEGSAYVFRLSFTGDWTQLQRLTGGLPGDRNGTSVAISENWILTGLPNRDVSGNSNQGAVFSYFRASTADPFGLPVEIHAPDGAAGDLFGASISMEGGLAVVGAEQADISGRSAQGAVYVFRRANNAWNFGEKLFDPNGTASDFYGNSVGISGDTILVGADRADPSGAASRGAVHFNRVNFVAPLGSRADFDGDGKTDISVFQPSGNWLTSYSHGGSNSGTWGNSTDILAPGDYDGDGRADAAVFRASTGQWYILRSSDASAAVITWGGSGDKPAVGDFDGDGRSDINIYRPSTGQWFLLRSSNGVSEIAQWGAVGDLPVPADFDGDGKTDIAVYRPSNGTWYVLKSSTGGFAAPWGAAGDKPTPADFDGDGKDDIAVYRPSEGRWYTFRSSDLGFDIVNWGGASDTPVPADYDGDGKDDYGVYRASSGEWFILRSTAGLMVQTWGSGPDKPLPAAYIP